MANIYCTECGTKNPYTLSKPKFCSSCGHPIQGANKMFATNPNKLSQSSAREDSDGSESVPSLNKLEYSVDMNTSKLTLGDVVNNPINPDTLEYNDKKIKGYKKLSKKALLNETTAECASSRYKDIDGKD